MTQHGGPGVKKGNGTGPHSCQSNTAGALFIVEKQAVCCLFELVLSGND